MLYLRMPNTVATQIPNKFEHQIVHTFPSFIRSRRIDRDPPPASFVDEGDVDAHQRVPVEEFNLMKGFCLGPPKKV